MSLLVSDILTDARIVHLGDDQAEIYTNTLLLQYFPTVYRNLFEFLKEDQSILARRRATTRLTASVNNFVLQNSPVLPGLGTGIINIYSRREDSFVDISSVVVTNGIPTYTTSSAHGRSVGDVVQVVNVEGLKGANTEGLVSAVPLTTSLTVQIPVLGTYSASGADGVSFSSMQWNWLRPVTSDVGNTISQPMCYWFTNGAYFFPISTENRQLMFEYYLEPSTEVFALSDTFPVEKVRDYLAVGTALLACELRAPQEVILRLEHKLNLIEDRLRRGLVKDMQRLTIRRASHWTTQVRRFGPK